MLVRPHASDIESQSDSGPSSLPTPALVVHIMVVHHDYLRTCLPNLKALVRRLLCTNETSGPWALLEPRIVRLADDLLVHLEDEESMVFPCLLELHREPGPLADALREMAADHTEVFFAMRAIRELADDYRLPTAACHDHRVLYAELERLELDMVRHAYLESVVLLPRFGAP